MVRRALADVHRDEGRREGSLAADKRTLLRQLRLRFSPLPVEVEQAIEATQDADRLAQWLDGIITKPDLDSIGIVPPR